MRPCYSPCHTGAMCSALAQTPALCQSSGAKTIEVVRELVLVAGNSDECCGVGDWGSFFVQLKASCFGGSCRGATRGAPGFRVS